MAVTPVHAETGRGRLADVRPVLNAPSRAWPGGGPNRATQRGKSPFLFFPATGWDNFRVFRMWDKHTPTQSEIVSATWRGGAQRCPSGIRTKSLTRFGFLNGARFRYSKVSHLSARGPSYLKLDDLLSIGTVSARPLLVVASQEQNKKFAPKLTYFLVLSVWS